MQISSRTSLSVFSICNVSGVLSYHVLLSVFFRADNTVFQINHIDKDYLRKTVYVLCRHKIFCYKNFSIVIVAHLSTSSWVFEAVSETLRQVWAFLGFFHALFNLFTRWFVIQLLHLCVTFVVKTLGKSMICEVSTDSTRWQSFIVAASVFVFFFSIFKTTHYNATGVIIGPATFPYTVTSFLMKLCFF